MHVLPVYTRIDTCILYMNTLPITMYFRDQVRFYWTSAGCGRKVHGELKMQQVEVKGYIIDLFDGLRVGSKLSNI